MFLKTENQTRLIFTIKSIILSIFVEKRSVMLEFLDGPSSQV